MVFSYHNNLSFHKNRKGVAHRRLQIESLENREMLSVTLADLPNPDYEASGSAYVANQVTTATDISPESVPNNAITTESTVSLAPPKSVKPACSATPSTLTVNWASPVASSALNTDQITHFEIIVTNAKTKQVVATTTVNADVRSALFEGLDVKTKYTITVTSCGGAGTTNAKGTLKISATTAAFPLVTVKASSMTLTTAKITVTDKDKITSFQNGLTVKTYKVEYVEKTKVLDWSQAQSFTIGADTPVADATKGTIVYELTGLNPGTQYAFRVIATYKDGVSVESTLISEGKSSTAKTAKLPAVSVTKTYFSVIDKTDYAFAISLTGKVASYAKLESGITIGYSLIVSTSTKINKTTGQLENSQVVASSTDLGCNATGVFTLDSVSLESIVEKLGRTNVLGTKALGMQLVLTFTFADGTVATSNSKIGKITLPTWYTPA